MYEVTVLTSKICVMKVIITSTFVYIFELESLVHCIDRSLCHTRPKSDRWFGVTMCVRTAVHMLKLTLGTPNVLITCSILD